METKFLTVSQKVKLIQQLEKGNKNAVQYAYDEINRLEMIVKDYEISMKVIKEKLNDKQSKEPKEFNLTTQPNP